MAEDHPLPSQRTDGPSLAQSPLLFLAIALAACLAFQLQLPAMPESDAFYHLGHAKVYVEHGPFFERFPWQTASEIGRLGGDLWYGFHILLIPFVLFGDPIAMLMIAGAAMLATMLLGIFLALRDVDLRLRWLTPTLILLSSPTEVIRWMALRPQLLSLACAALLLRELCRERPRGILLFTLSFGIAWPHLSFFWLPLLCVFAAGIPVYFVATRLIWRENLAVLAGVLAGAMLRPAPWETLQLLKIQLLDLSAAMRQGIPLSYGNELYPIPGDGLRDEYLAFLGVWLGGAVVAVILARKRMLPAASAYRSLLAASYLMSIAGYVIAVALTARGADIWVVFGSIFVALALTALVVPIKAMVANSYALVSAALIGWLGWWSVDAAWRAIRDVGQPPHRFEKAMAWLASNSLKGTIVATPHWSLFGQMFFWNRHNRYLAGMDPIFPYKFDQRRYWILHNLESGASVGSVRLGPVEQPGPMKDTYLALKEDLGASYLLLIGDYTPNLYRFCITDRRFKEVFSEGALAVFALDDPIRRRQSHLIRGK